MNKYPLTSHSGAALITVLGVLVVAGALAMQIVSITTNLIKGQAKSVQWEQRYWFAAGAEQLALQKLTQQEKGRLLPILAEYPIDQGLISLAVTAEHNCFNLNAFSTESRPDTINRVASEKTIIEALTNINEEEHNTAPISGITLKRQQLKTLFRVLSLEEHEAETFTDKLLDWIDKDDIITSYNGAETIYYTGLQPSRRASNNHLKHIQEIYQFAQLDNATLEKLIESACARPGDNRLAVNINQLVESDGPLLSAVLNGKLDPLAAANLLKLTPEDGYLDTTTFWAQSALRNLEIDDIIKSSFTIKSNYFKIDIIVRYQDQSIKLRTRLYLDEQKNISILSRKFGVAN